MNWLLILPIILPFAGAIANLFAWNHRRRQRVISVLTAGALLATGALLLRSVRLHGIQAAQMGAWPAPFGITLVADLFSAIMVVMTGIIALAVVVFSIINIDHQRVAYGYYPLVNVLLMGVCGAFLTGDIFNMYVWFEVLLISSFVLLGLGGTLHQLQATIKYVVINLISSTLFLVAIGLTYAFTGSLNLARIAVVMPELAQSQPVIVNVLAMMFLGAFGIKAALFPFYFWLPSSYHTPPASIAALFAGLLTKVGAYALIRVFTLIFVSDIGFTHQLILWLAGLTMVVGILGAVSQSEMRRVLSFNLISHIGYILMGLGLYTQAALAGAIFYTIHHMVVKTNLFLVTGIIRRRYGTSELVLLSGLSRSNPLLAAAFGISALALVGIPPLSGFWPKVRLLGDGLAGAHYAIVAAALFTSFLTLFSMARVWQAAFQGDVMANVQPPDKRERQRMTMELMPVLVLALLVVVIGVSAETIMQLSQAAAAQLIDIQPYLTAVGGAN